VALESINAIVALCFQGKRQITLFLLRTLFCMLLILILILIFLVLFLFLCRRDSLITHRAFCDALTEESARAQTLATTGNEGNGCNVKSVVASPPPPPLTPSTSVVSPGLSVQSSGN